MLKFTVFSGGQSDSFVMKPLQGAPGPIRRQRCAGTDEKKKPPSRRHVVCGIDGCSYDGEYRLHARHRQLMHSGKKAKYANDSLGVGGRFRSWVKRPKKDQDVPQHEKGE